MRFRLTYEGELRPNQRDPVASQTDTLASHKHAIRRHFHGQLRQLWETNRFLREHRVYPSDSAPQRPIADDAARWGGDPSGLIPMREALVRSGVNTAFGYNFLPLVWERFSLLCSLNILFLRRDIPGSAIQAGDIDNRIKTLIDTLRRPRSPNELMNGNGKRISPEPGEDPFYCLLEDDRQVSQISLETDTLLAPPNASGVDDRHVRLVVTVDLRPFDATMFNLSFV